MDKKDFIIINLNQNISKARQAAVKQEKNKWIIFGLILTIYIALITWGVLMNSSAGNLIADRKEKINYIDHETKKLTNDAIMELSDAEINEAYKLGKKWIPWSTKLIQFSEITPHDMCITKLDFSRGELKISAISRTEEGVKDMAICNRFIETLKSNEDFSREFEKINFDKYKRVETSKEPYISFEIIANIKKRQKNRIDEIILKEKGTEIAKKENEKKKRNEKIKDNENKQEGKIVASNVNQSNKKNTTVIESKDIVQENKSIEKVMREKNIINQKDESPHEESSFYDWPILNYFFSSTDSKKDEDALKESNDKKVTSAISNNVKENTIKVKKEKEPLYSKEIVELAQSINQNPANRESISTLQELMKIYNKSDPMYGKLDAKTILVISEILNKEPKSEWRKKFTEKNKTLVEGNYKKNDVPYSKHAIKLANQIANQNPNNPDPVLIKEFQEATGIAFEGDQGYGKFNPRTIAIWGDILGVEQ